MIDQITTLEEVENTLRAFELLEKSRNSLSAWIKLAWAQVEPGAPYVHGWHVDAIAEHLTAVTNGQITRLVINVPPGTMKSLITNVFWPSWEWGPMNMPWLRNISASHKLELSLRDNMKLRNLVTSEWYKRLFPHVVIKKDQNSKKKFENTKMGFSEAMAAGSITGSRADRVKIDDPLSVEDGLSKIVLATRQFWFREAIPTRVTNPEKSAIILIMQRLNELDTTQIALELGYEHLMLPMEYEPERRCVTSIGFQDPRTNDGELLFPERFPLHVVERDKKSLGTAAHAAQNQQRPAPREGAIFKVANLAHRFKLIRDFRGKLILTQFSEIFQSWDTAFKEGQENDYNVCTTWGLMNIGFYLINVARFKCDYPTLEKRTIELAQEYNPNQIFIEDKASGQSLIQSIRKRTILPIKPVMPDRDKLARAHAVSGYIEADRIFIAENDIWLNDYIAEMTTFPGTKHDDQVDSTCQFLMEVALRREVEIQKIQRSIIGR